MIQLYDEYYLGLFKEYFMKRNSSYNVKKKNNETK